MCFLVLGSLFHHMLFRKSLLKSSPRKVPMPSGIFVLGRGVIVRIIRSLSQGSDAGALSELMMA